MEYSAAFAFLFSELIAGMFIYTYWLRHRSGFDAARAEFDKAVKYHHTHGTLVQYIDSVADGKESLLEKRKERAPYLLILLSGILGLLAVYCMKQFEGAGVALRTIFGIIAMFPFIALLSVAIAKEADDNRILNYEQATATQLQEKIKQGTVDRYMAELN